MIYTTTFSNGKTVAITADDNDEFMERMVREHRSQMERGESRVSVKFRGEQMDAFTVSPEGFSAYLRMIEL